MAILSFGEDSDNYYVVKTYCRKIDILRDIADNLDYTREISDMLDKLCDRLEDTNDKLDFISDRLGELNETKK